MGSPSHGGGRSWCGRSSDAAGWLPHAADATWTYQWTDSVYNTTPTNENVTVKSQTGNSFTLAWTTNGRATARRAAEHRHRLVPGHELRHRQHRLDEHAAAASFPILCATLAQCGNSLASSLLQRDLGGARTGARRAAAAGISGRRRAARRTTSRARTTTSAPSRSPCRRSRCRCSRRRSARRSPRRARSAIRTAAACARSGGSTASAR